MTAAAWVLIVTALLLGIGANVRLDDIDRNKGK